MCNRVWTEGVFSLSLIIRTGVHGTLRHGLGDIWSLYHGVGGSYDICSQMSASGGCCRGVLVSMSGDVGEPLSLYCRSR